MKLVFDKAIMSVLRAVTSQRSHPKCCACILYASTKHDICRTEKRIRQKTILPETLFGVIYYSIQLILCEQGFRVANPVQPSEARFENGYGFKRPGLKTGVENGMFQSEIEELGSTNPPRNPKSTPQPHRFQKER